MPPLHDIAHLAHVELLTHKPEESLDFFVRYLGMTENAKAGEDPIFNGAIDNASGVATMLGVVFTDVVDPLADWGLALAAGVTLYVGASNLIPEFQGKTGWGHNVVFFVGCVIAYTLQAALGH